LFGSDPRRRQVGIGLRIKALGFSVCQANEDMGVARWPVPGGPAGRETCEEDKARYGADGGT
jgi:hypothetical protein